MSEVAPKTDNETDSATDAPPAKAKSRLWRKIVHASTMIAAGLVALTLVLAVGVRYGADTPFGRALIVRAVDGLKLGAVGRLHIEGLRGDIFGEFGLRRLQVIDAKGVWLQADDLFMVWDPGELLGRRFHASRIAAKGLRIARQPMMQKQPPSAPSKPPVSLIIDHLALRLETLPDFSVQRGLWDVTGKLIVRRSGSARGTLDAKSLLHAGDGLSLAFQIGQKDKMLLRADAVEANGGALAGALGLPANQRLAIQARGDGTFAEGRLNATALSGAQTPLSLDATWSPAGARATGRISLAASIRTRYFADRLGPDVNVTLFAKQAGSQKVGAKQAGSTLYAVDGVATARDGRLTINGPIDLRRHRVEGARVLIAVSDLSHWLSLPKLGATTVVGALTGDIDTFTLKGDAKGQRLEQNGVTVDSMAGPLTLTRANREWRIGADLQGAGVKGPAPFAPLLGQRPRIALDLSILKGNRFLIRSLNLVGSGVKATAEGGQGLLGGLSFKGSLQVSDLTPVHAGAHGTVAASWDASEAKGGKVWSVAFDAKGASFATGLAELDRFLGAQPRLVAKGAFGQGVLTVDKADLAGGALQASMKGVLGEHEALAFDVDWSAKGPFVAGPVEIAGEAKGSGKISGSLGAPRTDLTADLASIDFGRLVITPARLSLSFLKGPDGLDGLAALEGPTDKYGRASLKTAFRFAGSGIVLSDLVADAGGVKLSGALSLQNGTPSSADLTLVAGPGAFLSAGKLVGAAKLVDRAGIATADLRLDGEGVASPDLPVSLRTLHLRASGPLAHLPFQASADSVDPLAWAFKGDGVYSHDKDGAEVVLNGAGKIRKAAYRTLSPATIRFGAQGRSAALTLAFAGGKLNLDARQTAEALDAKADFSGVGLAALQEDFTGIASGRLSLKGQGAHLAGALDATLEGARSRDAPVGEALNAKIDGTLSDHLLHLAASASNAEGLQSKFEVDLPAEAAAAPFRIAIDRTKPLHGSFSAEGEVRPLWDLLGSGERTLSGKLSANAAVGGTLADPTATGSASLTAAKFRDVTTGLALQNLAVAAAFGHDQITVSQFSGADARGGTLTGTGQISLTRDGGSNFTLNAHRFQLIDNDIGRATASGAVTVTRDADGKARLAGALTIDRADFAASTPTPTGVVPLDVIEINQAPKEGVEKPQPKGVGPQITLDVTLKAGRGIFLKGKGLDTELSLDAHVGGAITHPELTGVAKIVRGSYDFAGQRFDFDNFGTVRLGSSADQIRLDLTATRQDPTLTAVGKVSGTAAKPEISLSSTPVLPQDEVLSRVLFGVSAAQLSAAQGAQLVSALASLQGGGGFDVIGNLRQFAGLDRLALGGTQASGTTVSGGKYLTNNVYLELTGGGRTGPSAQVEWRVRRDLSLVSMVGTQGDARLSVRFRKDY